MPRKPDTPCSICGTLIWSGTGSLTADKRVCRPCRRTRIVTVSVSCTACGEPFERPAGSGGNPRKTCSPKCARRLQTEGIRRGRLALVAVDHPCQDCGQDFRALLQVKRCEPCAKLRRIERWRGKNRRRRLRLRDAVSEPYTLAEIAERDGFRCKLCRRKVNMRLQFPHLKAPTIDHVIPLVDGGDDTRVNAQLAHFQCNSRKGAGGIQQLALMG